MWEPGPDSWEPEARAAAARTIPNDRPALKIILNVKRGTDAPEKFGLNLRGPHVLVWGQRRYNIFLTILVPKTGLLKKHPWNPRNTWDPKCPWDSWVSKVPWVSKVFLGPMGI